MVVAPEEGKEQKDSFTLFLSFDFGFVKVQVMRAFIYKCKEIVRGRGGNANIK